MTNTAPPEPAARPASRPGSSQITLRRRVAIAWRRLRAFLRSEKQVWTAPAVVVAAVLVSLPAVETLEQQITYAGAILQVLGLATVAWGLHRSRELFELPSLWSQFRQVFARPRDVVANLEGESGIEFGISASLSVGLPKDATNEQRLAELERRMDEAEKGIREATKKLESHASELRGEIEAEQQERQRADATLDQKIKTAAVGGIRLEQAGLVWLVAGVVFATVPGVVVWATRPARHWLGLG